MYLLEVLSVFLIRKKLLTHSIMISSGWKALEIVVSVWIADRIYRDEILVPIEGSHWEQKEEFEGSKKLRLRCLTVPCVYE